MKEKPRDGEGGVNREQRTGNGAGSGDEMYTDLSEIWDVTLINPNLL